MTNRKNKLKTAREQLNEVLLELEKRTKIDLEDLEEFIGCAGIVMLWLAFKDEHVKNELLNSIADTISNEEKNDLIDLISKELQDLIG